MGAVYAPAVPDATPPAAADHVLTLARERGFVLAGIAPALPAERPEAHRAWISAGRHGEMHYLAEHLEVRLDPNQLVPDAQSVIAVADAYGKWPSDQVTKGPSEEPIEQASHHSATGPPGHSATSHGRVARYAHGADYHKVLKKRLHGLADALAAEHPGHTFRTTVDTAPALEREHAARAGLGWTGKNTLLIHPRHGSFFLLGLIVTTLKLETSEDAGYPSPTVPATDHCANCTRCIDACPTDAIAPEGYTLDATKCVSYLTLEHRSPIDPALHSGIGDWLGGCDVCQDVCPYNAVAARQEVALPVHERYAPRAEVADGLRLIDVIRWTDDDRAAAFRGSALKRMKLDMVRRNALIAAGNALAQRGDAELEAAVRACVDDASELVAVTARQVVARLDVDGEI